MSNPILTLLPLNGSLGGRDRVTGSFTATGAGSLRWAPAEGARVNQICNPRMAVNTVGWSGIASSSLSRVVDSRFQGGTALEITTGGINNFDGVSTSTAFINVRNMPEAGSNVTQVTISFDIIAISGPLSFEVDGHFRDADGANPITCGVTLPFTVTSQGVLQRLSFTATFNSFFWDKSFAGLGFVAGSVNGNQPRTFRVSNIVLEYGSVPNATYFDGSYPGCNFFDPRTGQLASAWTSPSCNQLTAWIEEGTTNLLLNPSVEHGTASTGIYVVGAGTITYTKDTTTAYLGAASAKLVCDGTSADQGVVFSSSAGLATMSARTFIGSIWARGSGTVDFRVRAVYTDSPQNESANTTVTLTSTWQRVVTPTVVTIAGKTLEGVQLHCRTNSAQAVTFYADCAQVEEKLYATSFCSGDLGSGYSWAGTPHASASTRAQSWISVSDAPQRMNFDNGSYIVSVKMLNPSYTGTEGQWMVDFGLRYTGKHGALFYLPDGSMCYQSRINGSYTGTAAVPHIPGSRVKFYSQISPAFLGIAADNGALLQVARSFSDEFALEGGEIRIGAYATKPTYYPNRGSLLGPVAIFSRELTDVERAAYNTRIDAFGDLWTLYEQRVGGLVRTEPDAPYSLIRTPHQLL